MSASTAAVKSKLELENLEIVSGTIGSENEPTNLVLKIKKTIKQELIDHIRFSLQPQKSNGNLVSCIICFKNGVENSDDFKNCYDFIFTHYAYCAVKTSGINSNIEITFTLTTYPIAHINRIFSEIFKKFPGLTFNLTENGPITDLLTDDLITLYKSKSNKALEAIEVFYETQLNPGSKSLALQISALQQVLPTSEKEKKTMSETIAAIRVAQKIVDAQPSTRLSKKTMLLKDLELLTKTAREIDIANKFPDSTIHLLAHELQKAGLFEHALVLFKQVRYVKDPSAHYRYDSQFRDSLFQCATIPRKLLAATKKSRRIKSNVPKNKDTKSGKDNAENSVVALSVRNAATAAGVSVATAASGTAAATPATSTQLKRNVELSSIEQFCKPLSGEVAKTGSGIDPTSASAASADKKISIEDIQNADGHLNELSNDSQNTMAADKAALPFLIFNAYHYVHEPSIKRAKTIIETYIHIDPKINKDINDTKKASISPAESLLANVKENTAEREKAKETAQIIIGNAESRATRDREYEVSIVGDTIYNTLVKNLQSGHPESGMDKLISAVDTLFKEENLNEQYCSTNIALARRRHNNEPNNPPVRPTRPSDANLRRVMTAQSAKDSHEKGAVSQTTPSSPISPAASSPIRPALDTGTGPAFMTSRMSIHQPVAVQVPVSSPNDTTLVNPDGDVPAASPLPVSPLLNLANPAPSLTSSASLTVATVRDVPKTIVISAAGAAASTATSATTPNTGTKATTSTAGKATTVSTAVSSSTPSILNPKAQIPTSTKVVPPALPALPATPSATAKGNNKSTVKPSLPALPPAPKNTPVPAASASAVSTSSTPTVSKAVSTSAPSSKSGKEDAAVHVSTGSAAVNHNASAGKFKFPQAAAKHTAIPAAIGNTAANTTESTTAASTATSHVATPASATSTNVGIIKKPNVAATAVTTLNSSSNTSTGSKPPVILGGPALASNLAAALAKRSAAAASSTSNTSASADTESKKGARKAGS